VKTQRAADIVVGCVVALLGIFVLISSMVISEMGAAHRLSPRAFPFTVSFLLFFCGGGLALKSWTLREEGPLIPWPDREGVRTILVNLVSLALYIGVLNWLGVPLATFLYLAFTIWYLKKSKWLMAIVIGLITGVLSYYLFINLLGLSFPVGVLFEG
jgi:putative tricarboxylic transport membrane protein